MLDLVKIFPSIFLVTSASVGSGALEVSPEITMGHFPPENQGTIRDGTYERSWPRVFQESIFIPGGGGVSVGVGGHVPSGRAFMETVRHDRSVGSLVTFGAGCLWALYESYGRMEVSFRLQWKAAGGIMWKDLD